jgi:hypothetical protein
LKIVTPWSLEPSLAQELEREGGDFHPPTGFRKKAYFLLELAKPPAMLVGPVAPILVSQTTLQGNLFAVSLKVCLPGSPFSPSALLDLQSVERPMKRGWETFAPNPLPW